MLGLRVMGKKGLDAYGEIDEHREKHDIPLVMKQALGYAAFLRSVGAQALCGGLCKEPVPVFPLTSKVPQKPRKCIANTNSTKNSLMLIDG